MGVIFGPSGLGPIKTAESFLEQLHAAGLRACELAFTHSIYMKKEEDAIRIGKKAKELGITLSIHAPYYVNLNAVDKEKREATKQRILACCEIGELMGAKSVVFHPGYYGKGERSAAYTAIRDGIRELMDIRKEKGWKILLAPETMGKVNVFGSIEEISQLVKDTGCSFCIDFAHILARDKTVDYDKIAKLFPGNYWHIHFSGIVYGDLGEKHHKTTLKEEWETLLNNLPKDKECVIINESPTQLDDAIEGLSLYEKMKN